MTPRPCARCGQPLTGYLNTGNRQFCAPCGVLRKRTRADGPPCARCGEPTHGPTSTGWCRRCRAWAHRQETLPDARYAPERAAQIEARFQAALARIVWERKQAGGLSVEDVWRQRPGSSVADRMAGDG